MPSPLVLILTHAADAYVPDLVAAGVARRGGRAVRVDTDRFPAAIALAWRLGGEAALRVGGEWIDLARVTGVWLRRVLPPALPADLDPRDAPQITLEATATLQALLGHLQGRARVVDPPSDADKPRQLREAVAAGLAVPPTLITNDPASARRFVAEHGAVVCKLQTSALFAMEGRAGATHTRRLGADDVAALDALTLCPMMFQPLVPKRRELRVAWVRGRAFCGAVRTDAVDWRDPRAATSGWEPASLPPDVHAALDRLMTALGLAFGAVDLIETPDGRHVFLEVNPGGEWGMLERDLGLPIGDAIAAALCEP
jgi:hypothetical protein